MDLVAFRGHVHVADVRRGCRIERWRGGVKQCVAGQPTQLVVLAEVGAPLTYTGPIAESTEIVAVVCRMVGRWPYRVAEVRPGEWASSSDAARAREGEGGIYGVIPFDIRGEDRVLWREHAWTPVDAQW
jgi:hypothetical protein